MPTLQPPPAPAPPKAPTRPPINTPTRLHHNVPRSVPTAEPGVRPSRSGGISTAIGVAVLNNVLCPIGTTIRAGKKPPQKSEKKPRRRQSPCQGGGEPQVEHRDRKRKIGYFSINKLTSGPTQARLRSVVDAKTRKVAKRAGYDLNRKNVRVIAELTGPQGFLDQIGAFFGGTSEKCYYNVFAIEKRRVCTCPDGSPCRSTTRRD